MHLKLVKYALVALGTLAPGLAASMAVRLFYSPRKFPMTKWEEAALAKGAPSELEWKGRRLAVHIWGQGPTVLLVHGWEGRGSQLGKIALSLAVRGYRVIAFDGPAHGSSLERRTTLVEFAQAVSCAVQTFGPVRGIVGHSFGAAAACIAIQQGADVERLVLISCPYSIRNVVGRFAQVLGVPEHVHRRMWPIMERLHGCSAEDLSFERIGPSVGVPCLMLHDGGDVYVPYKDGEAVSKLIEGARLIQTEKLGHLRILQNESVVEQATAFIAPRHAVSAKGA